MSTASEKAAAERAAALKRARAHLAGENPYGMTLDQAEDELANATLALNKILDAIDRARGDRRPVDELNRQHREAAFRVTAAQDRVWALQRAAGNQAREPTTPPPRGNTRTANKSKSYPQPTGVHNQYSELSVKELRAMLERLGGSSEGMVEKDDLLKAVRAAARAAAPPRRAPPPPPAANNTRRSAAANNARRRDANNASRRAANNARRRAANNASRRAANNAERVRQARARAKAETNAKAKANAKAREEAIAAGTNEAPPPNISSIYFKDNKFIDLYEILEVARDASLTDIKRAFRKKALESHQNKGGQGIGHITPAYEVLGDKDNKAEYDKQYDKYVR